MTLRFAERITRDSDSPWIAEHLSRYFFAASAAAGKDVLDVACGVGLGHDAIVNAGARTLLGVDVSRDALLEAQTIGSSAGYCQADAHRLPFGPQSFDICLSFETIEHLRLPDLFVASVARVLRRDGRLYLSTPNSEFLAKNKTPRKNPFHFHDFNKHTLGSLLKRNFSNVTLLGQRVNPVFGPCPYWDVTPGPSSFNPAILKWKLRRRLRDKWGEKLSWALGNQPLIPAPEDFLFGKETQSAHSLLAICSGPRSD